jgi:hypothetical protein
MLRRALDASLVDRDHYQKKAGEWARQAQARRAGRRPSGGDYYATQASYLGRAFLHLAFSRYYQGRCTREQLAEYLNVRVGRLVRLEPFAIASGHPR